MSDADEDMEDYVDVVPGSLRPVDQVDGTRDYLRDVWSRRGYWISVPADDLRAKNRHTVLGPFWLLIDPAMEIAVYYLIFGLLLGVDRGLTNFIGFLTVGIITFGLTARPLTPAARLMIRNTALIRSLQFPKAVLPLAETMRSGYTFLLGVPAMLATVLLTGEPLRWQWVLLVPAFAIALVFAAGAILIVARLGRRYADLEPLIGHGIRLLFYMSGVLYEPSRWTSRADIKALFDVNPFYEMNTLMRSAVLTDITAPAWMWAAASAWAVGVFSVGLIFFKQGEGGYGA